eukprot:g8290.t1
MRFIPVLALTLTILIPTASQADEQAELKKLQGDYKITKLSRKGKNAPADALKSKLNIKDNVFTMISPRNGGERKEPINAKIDDTKSPKHATAEGVRKTPVKSVIVLQKYGAPSHVDLWDMKPAAPAEIRGEFQSIPTRIPGYRVCEHMTASVRHVHKMTVVRSMAHTVANHNPATYFMLTGRTSITDVVQVGAKPDDWPNMGSALAKLRPGDGKLPDSAILPHLCYDQVYTTPGQFGGKLGKRFDPFVIAQDPNRADFSVKTLQLRQGLSAQRLSNRRNLLKTIDRQQRRIEKTAAIVGMDEYYDRAWTMLTSPEAKNAFDIHQEPAAVRDRYGRTQPGQSMLLARRLVEAGVRFVTSGDGTLVAWTVDSGDSSKSHVVHVDENGIAWALNLKEPEVVGRLVGEATQRPDDAGTIIETHRGGRRVLRKRLAGVAFAEQLNQLTIVDTDGKKQHIAYGDDGEQEKIFKAARRHFGGTVRKEDADAWSVMKTPLFALSVTAVIGGFLIWMAAISDPNAEITGRRSGMKRLINWLGYTIGPTWMSIFVGAVALLIVSFMVFLLIKRPERGNWPRFRGPGGAGLSGETGLPETWSAQSNIAWKTPLPGPGSSSPVIWGDHVYVTCYSGYGLDVKSPGQKSNLQRHLFCIDRGNGRVVWKKSKPLSGDIAAYSSPHTIGKHGYATSTPVADESGVYVFYGADGVIAYTHSGEQRWQAACGSKVNNYGSATSPILYGDLLFVHAGVQSGALLAFNKNTGREVWRVTGLLPSFWTPLIVKSNGRDELLYSGNYDYQVGAVDPRTGAKLWNCKTNVGTINGSPVADGNVVFLLGKNNKSAAMRTGGSGNVSATHQVWEAGKGAYITSPIYYNGHVYWSRDGGIVYCLDAKTGRVVYEKRIQGYVYASPVIADGKLYYVTRERGVLVLPASPEFRILSHNKIETDRIYYLCHHGRPVLRCLRKADGKEIWARQLVGPTGERSYGHTGSPLPWKNLIIVNVGTGAAVDRTTGRIVWQHSGLPGLATPVLYEDVKTKQPGVLIFAGRKLIARDARTGRELCSIPWKTNIAVNASDPIYHAGRAFISTTYGKHAALFDLGSGRAEQSDSNATGGHEPPDSQTAVSGVAESTAIQQVGLQDVKADAALDDGAVVPPSPKGANGDEMTLLQLVQLALDQNPRLARLDQQYQAAAARTEYVDKLPDPRVGANVFGNPIETASGSQRANLSFSQAIPWLGRLKAASQKAAFEAFAIREEYQAARLRVISGVRTGWYRLFVIDRQIETTRANQKLLNSLIRVANARIATGKAQRGDVLLGTLELSQLEERLLTYRRQRRAVEAEINRLTGRAADTPIPSPEALDVGVPKLAAKAIHQIALESQPEIQAIRLRTEAARWGVEVARLSRRPEFSFSANYFVTDNNRPASSVVSVGEDPWALGVQMSLPLWKKKYDAMTNEARWKNEAAYSSVQELADRYDALVLDLVTEARRAAETAELYRTTILPQARQTLSADQASYSNGAVEFDRVIRDYRILLTLELGYQKAIGDLAVANARIQQAAGRDLTFSTIPSKAEPQSPEPKP